MCIDGKYRIYVARLRNGGKTHPRQFWLVYQLVPLHFFLP